MYFKYSTSNGRRLGPMCEPYAMCYSGHCIIYGPLYFEYLCCCSCAIVNRYMQDYVDTGSLSLYPTLLDGLQRFDSGWGRRTATVPTQAAALALPAPGAPATAAGPFSIVGSGDRIALQTTTGSTSSSIRALQVYSLLPDAAYPQSSIIEVRVQFSGPVTVQQPTIAGKLKCSLALQCLMGQAH